MQSTPIQNFAIDNMFEVPIDFTKDGVNYRMTAMVDIETKRRLHEDPEFLKDFVQKYDANYDYENIAVSDQSVLQKLLLQKDDDESVILEELEFEEEDPSELLQEVDQILVEEPDEPELYWKSSVVRCLLRERFKMETYFVNRMRTKSGLWTEIVNKVNNETNSNITIMEAQRKFNNLKTTYKRTKQRLNGKSQVTSNWEFYEEFDKQYSKGFALSPLPAGLYTEDQNDSQELLTEIKREPSDLNLSEDWVEESGDDDYKWTRAITELLILERIQVEKEYKSGTVSNKTLWLAVAKKMNAKTNCHFTTSEIKSKYYNLKTTYKRNVDRKNKTGQIINWEFYNLFDRHYGAKFNKPEIKNSLISTLDVTSSTQTDPSMSKINKDVSEHGWADSKLDIEDSSDDEDDVPSLTKKRKLSHQEWMRNFLIEDKLEERKLMKQAMVLEERKVNDISRIGNIIDTLLKKIINK